MRKSLSYKVLLSVLALSTINYASPANVLAGVDAYNNYNVTYNGETVTGKYNTVYGNEHSFTFEGEAIEIYGSIKNPTTNAISNINITVNNSNVSADVFGVLSETNSNSTITNNHVTINSSKGLNIVCGASSSGGVVTNNYVTINDSEVSYEVCGGASTNGEVSNNYVIINESTINNINKNTVVRGGASDTGNVFENHVTINGGTLNSVQGGFSNTGNVNDNHVTISNATITGSIVGGYNRDNTPAEIEIKNNSITIKGTTDISNASLHGYATEQSAANIKAENNRLILDGWSGTVNSIHNFDSITFKNIDLSQKEITLDVTSGVIGMDGVAIYINSIAMAGDYKTGSNNHLLSWDENINKGTVTIEGDITKSINTANYYTADRSGEDGIYATKFNDLTVSTSNTSDNQIEIFADIKNSVLTGKFIDESGAVRYNSNQTEDTASLTIGNGFTTNVATVAGVYAAKKTDDSSQTATGGKVNISGDNITYGGTVYAGYSEGGSVNDNIINVAAGTNAQNMILKGYNSDANADGNAASGHSGNTLNITGNGSTFNSVENFETINFNKVALNSSNVLSLQNADLGSTTLNVTSLAGGNNYDVGDKVTLIKSENAITGTSAGINIANDIVTAGVARDLTVSATQSEDNTSIDLTVSSVKQNSQVNLVAENRAVAAAFVNQGTDLISDSLDTISRDDNYGVKTFAAVHGNRSKYDVNSDIKINGWSTIVGVGNADKFDNGSEFSWGVFYENGSGNYRTYNEFNNEFFRGDGSLVYNGGGIAARYTNKNGVYTEGSLRAGMLKSDMDNALRDGAGNFYGYESESAYYGAHLGIGKIISLSDSSDLDVYGKFFHTYTEGDSFKVANDEFEFDSINSDRLRIGARITSNKENKFSTYYGLAYEYEFNGDADMTAQGLKAPTQSLQGSSVMAEIGFNYQPTPTSPWSFDLNMRGYTGERQGGSFNVQATYTF